MRSKSRFFATISLGVVLGLTASFGSGVFAKRAIEDNQIPLEALRSFTDAYTRIKNDYVEEVDDRELLENAIRGMLSGLDPHSSYLNGEEFKDLQIGTTGEFGGLGIEVGMESGFIKVISPIDDTPAERAGVHAGDLIIRLDDEPVKGKSLSESVKIMRGKPGSPIVLTIIREGEEKPLKLTIIRAIIKVTSVKSRMLDKGYGYIRVTQFQSNSGPNLVKAASDLKKKHGGPLKGMVLDLRNNPGGVLSAAVQISDAFMDKGLIVYTEGRVNDSRLRFNAAPGDVLDGMPLVILINGGSASASEIVAGALQDHKRAILMGTRSFGKGSVQTIMPARGGTAIKLTTARYYTPNGRSIQAEGIEPDIEVKRRRLSAVVKPVIETLKEKDLSGHLTNGKDGDKEDKKDKAGDAKSGKLAQDDYQLFEALNLLKGLNIARQFAP